MTRIQVAVVGLGYWGPQIARVFNDAKDCLLTMVCDQKKDRLEAATHKYGFAVCTDNFEEVLTNPNVDAVVIATPIPSHYSLAKRALEADKHVLVEKPLAMSVAQAEELTNLAWAKSRILMAGHTFIYSPPVRKVKEILDKKVLGKIYTMDFSRVNLGLFQPDANVLWDLAPHDISIALYWLGKEPISVKASARNFIRPKIEEVGYLSMEFPGGVWVNTQVSWLAPVKLRRVSIVGSKKMLVYDDTENTEKIKIYDRGVLKNPDSFGEFQLTYRSGDIHIPNIESAEPLALECAEFIRCICTGEHPVSDGEFGTKVVRVLEKAQESLKQSKEPL